MESERFDQLAKILSGPGSRRRALVAFAGSLALLSLVPHDNALAKKPCPPCKKRKQGKCKGKKPDGATCPGGACKGGRCVPICQVCPVCHSCNTATGKCLPDAALVGQACGTCRTCDATGQCLVVGDTTPCDDGNPCTVNTFCTNGVCGGPSANQGKVCGASTHGGTALRCCNGTCPDPNCVPSGVTGVACNDNTICSTLNCCAQQFTTCDGSNHCMCFFAQANEPCGSDLDCSMSGGPSTACICGMCKAPPP